MSATQQSQQTNIFFANRLTITFSIERSFFQACEEIDNRLSAVESERQKTFISSIFTALLFYWKQRGLLCLPDSNEIKNQLTKLLQQPLKKLYIKYKKSKNGVSIFWEAIEKLKYQSRKKLSNLPILIQKKQSEKRCVILCDKYDPENQYFDPYHLWEAFTSNTISLLQDLEKNSSLPEGIIFSDENIAIHKELALSFFAAQKIKIFDPYFINAHFLKKIKCKENFDKLSWSVDPLIRILEEISIINEHFKHFAPSNKINMRTLEIAYRFDKLKSSIKKDYQRNNIPLTTLPSDSQIEAEVTLALQKVFLPFIQKKILAKIEVYSIPISTISQKHITSSHNKKKKHIHYRFMICNKRSFLLDQGMISIDEDKQGTLIALLDGFKTFNQNWKTAIQNITPLTLS